MANVLVIGCSFCLGWWDFNNDGVERSNPDYGWFDELGHDVTVYAHDGGGIMAFAECLEYLSDTMKSRVNLHNYDAILIQESWVPRINIQRNLSYKKIRNNIYQWEIDRLFLNNMHVWPEMKKSIAEEFNFEWQPNMDNWLATVNKLPNGYRTLNRACASYLDDLAEQSGIPTYSYSFTGIKYPYKYIKYLDVPCATDELFFRNKLHNFDLTTGFEGHFTKQGNKKLGQLIKEGLDIELS